MYYPQETQDVIHACIKSNLPVLLRGETGTGKTTLIKTIAKEKKVKVMRINLTGQTTREDLIGKYILQDDSLHWQDGPLATALRKGYWILLDELNAALPEVLFVLQALLESDGKLGELMLSEKDGEIIKPDRRCRIFATCNPSDYEGMKDFNQATLSRFIVMDVYPMEIHYEEQFLTDKYKIDVARGLVEGAARARQKKKDGETSVFISTRDLEMAARLIAENIPFHLAVKSGILSKCQTDLDYKVIAACFDSAAVKGQKTFMDQLKEVEEEKKTLQERLSSMESLQNTLSALKDVQNTLNSALSPSKGLKAYEVKDAKLVDPCAAEERLFKTIEVED